MITTSILAKVEAQRLQRAVEGLCNGAYAITLTSQSEHEISGYVRNGDNVTYGVTLTKDRAFCSCKDAMFRHTTCKHAVALALHAIRTPHEEKPRQLEGRIGKVTYLEQRAPDLRLGKVRRNFAFSA